MHNFQVPLAVRLSHICSWIWLTAVVSLPASVPWVNLYSYHITKTFVPFSQTHSVDKAFFMVLLYKPPDMCFLIASHDAWQTQLPAWW